MNTRGNVMKFIKITFIVLFFAVSLTSCSNPITGCPDAEIEWVDVIMNNDIKYQHHFPDPLDKNTPITFEKGKEIGKVSYMMAGNACSNHKTKNGDATYLEKGTPIYEIKGYPSSFAVVANDKVYIADENKNAKSAGEFIPLEDLVKDIHIESTEDGSILHTFAPSSKEKFITIWENLKLEDENKLYKNHSYKGDPVFLEIELNNGVSFRLVYWKKSNIFSRGVVGNNKMKQIIDDELSTVK
jgi:hypothetical protein